MIGVLKYGELEEISMILDVTLFKFVLNKNCHVFTVTAQYLNIIDFSQVKGNGLIFSKKLFSGLQNNFQKPKV